MNILVFSWRDPKHPLAGGAEQVMHEHMKGWVSAGHAVTMFSAHYKTGLRRENIDGVAVMRYGYQIFGVHIMACLWYIFINKTKFDLVVDQFHGIPFFTPVFVRVKKLAVLQELAKEVWLTNPLVRPLNMVFGWAGYLLERYFFLFYKQVPFMVGSKSTKQELMSMGISEANITIVPHGVLLDLPKPLPHKEKQNTIVFLGALTKDKGIEDAVNAFALINKDEGNFKFWILGKGSDGYIKHLRNMVVKLGLSSKVDFFGYVSQSEKFELLAKAHLLVNPSFREGWGLVNIEANAVMTPVVAYPSQGLVDSVQNNINGVLCEKNTPWSMKDSVLKILHNKEFYQKLQKGGLEWSRKFTWNNSRKLSLRLIEKITHD